jgi:hypothetical protein
MEIKHDPMDYEAIVMPWEAVEKTTIPLFADTATLAAPV